jgi:ATP-dependent DNA helicase RecG
MEIIEITPDEVAKLFSREEGHFLDFKGIDVKPAKLLRTVSALANADGGELYIGISQGSSGGEKSWIGFKAVEHANGLVQAIEQSLPLGQYNKMEFLRAPTERGLVLHAEIFKTREIIKTASGEIYVRRGAQNIPKKGEQIRRLELDKGIYSFETETVDVTEDVIDNSHVIIGFMIEVVPQTEPDNWLKKQMLIVNGKPTVAGVVLFADEPQAILPKRCGIKIYRYKSSQEEGTRETLDGQPITVEGCSYRQIYDAVGTTKEIIESIRRMTSEGLIEVEYPEETLHEIITNAVIHRDYSIPDDVHIRIHDDRVEVENPGLLPGHITVDNILDERFARNGNIVRIINKFPNPPNKDVGEGLNTAFRAMHLLKLKEPKIVQKENSVLVIISHQKLASPEEQIMEYLEDNETISNGKARELCVIREDWRIRAIFKKMVDAGLIEKVPGSTTSNTLYRKAT